MSAPLELVFTESGEVLGAIKVIDGQLIGPESLKGVVRNRMQRNGVDAEAAVVSLHGWSNGYLSSRLVQHD